MSATETHYVGEDNGHDAIKTVAESGDTTSTPARARSGRHMVSWQDGSDGDGFYRTEDGGDFTVNAFLPKHDATDFKDYPKSPLNRVLVHHALRQAGFGGKRVAIATGLPISYYYKADGQRDETYIEAARQNLLLPVTSNGSPLAQIVDNIVTVEAIAAYFDQLMDLTGKQTAHFDSLRKSMVGIVDIGGGTTDVAVVLPGGQDLDIERSGSDRVGMLQLNSAIDARLRERFDLESVTLKKIEDAIRTNRVEIGGESFDVSDLVEKEKTAIAKQILSKVQSRLGNGRDLDTILFVGGGSLVLGEQLKATFKHGRVVEEPVYANACGMLKIVKYVRR